MSLTATHITADTATVTVASQREEVADWSRRYFGPWWNATITVEAYSGGSIAENGGGPVLADTDPARVEDGAPQYRPDALDRVCSTICR